MTSPNSQNQPLKRSRPRVVIADDSRVIRHSMMKILGTDFDVVQAENGEIAWGRICQDADVRALITDIEMPVMDGYELICRIRAAEDSHINKLPVITMTGAEDDASKERAFACGATDFITKPVDPDRLRARVHEHAYNSQPTHELGESPQSSEDQTISDPLTGLRSRRYFHQRCEQDIAYALRHGADLSVVRIDIDGFKKLYQTCGDQLADRILVWLAKVLYACARTEDTVARLSGTEFAILANGTSIADAARLCERIQDDLASQPFGHEQGTIPLTLSMGLASLAQDRRETADSLLALARQRLGRARSEGGNRFCISVLGGKTPEVEEIIIAPMSPEAPTEQRPPLSRETADLREVEVPSDVAAVSPPPSLRGPNPDATQPAGIPLELLSMDRALYLLAQGRVEQLLPFLGAIKKQLQPLIDLCAAVNVESGRPTGDTVYFEIKR
jgi:two-component system cell cycle response regulator